MTIVVNWDVKLQTKQTKYDIDVIQWITSCFKYDMMTRFIYTFVGFCNIMTIPVTTMHPLSYHKQILTLTVVTEGLFDKLHMK